MANPYTTLAKKTREVALNLPAPSTSRGTFIRDQNIRPERKNFFDRVANTHPLRTNKKAFGDAYRELWPGHDELVSTAVVRELMWGILDNPEYKNYTPMQKEEINRVFDNISAQRLPTSYSGHILRDPITDEILINQHPTSPGESAFSKTTEGLKTHRQLDIARGNAAVNAGSKELSADGSFEEVLNAVTSAAIASTTSGFTGPLSAENVRRMLPVSVSDDEALSQMILRENAKKSGVEFAVRTRTQSNLYPTNTSSSSSLFSSNDPGRDFILKKIGDDFPPSSPPRDGKRETPFSPDKGSRQWKIQRIQKKVFMPNPSSSNGFPIDGADGQSLFSTSPSSSTGAGPASIDTGYPFQGSDGQILFPESLSDAYASLEPFVTSSSSVDTEYPFMTSDDESSFSEPLVFSSFPGSQTESPI